MAHEVSPKFRTILGLLTLAVAVWFFWPQLGTIALTCLIAYIFYPLYKRISVKGTALAASVTLLASFLVVLIPIAFVSISAFSQLMLFANEAGDARTWQGLTENMDGTIGMINGILDPITGENPSLTDMGVAEFLSNHLPDIARGAAQLIFGVLTSLPQLFVALIVYIYVFVYLLWHGPSVIQKIKQVSPLPKEATELYIRRTGAMARAMVTGQLMVSMILAAFSALILIPLGYGHLFFVLFVLFTVLNFIPLGSGIVMVPLSLYGMLTGQFWTGLIVILLYYGFGNLEPLYRTKFIPKDTQLPVSLMLLSTFCGIAYFGILGVVYGPIITILIMMSFSLYVDLGKRSKTPTR